MSANAQRLRGRAFHAAMDAQREAKKLEYELRHCTFKPLTKKKNITRAQRANSMQEIIPMAQQVIPMAQRAIPIVQEAIPIVHVIPVAQGPLNEASDSVKAIDWKGIALELNRRLLASQAQCHEQAKQLEQTSIDSQAQAIEYRHKLDEANEAVKEYSIKLSQVQDELKKFNNHHEEYLNMTATNEYLKKKVNYLNEGHHLQQRENERLAEQCQEMQATIKYLENEINALVEMNNQEKKYLHHQLHQVEETSNGFMDRVVQLMEEKETQESETNAIVTKLRHELNAEQSSKKSLEVEMLKLQEQLSKQQQ